MNFGWNVHTTFTSHHIPHHTCSRRWCYLCCFVLLMVLNIRVPVLRFSRPLLTPAHFVLSACLMSWCAYELTQNPRVEDKLMDELRTSYEYKQPTYEATTLPYLQAFIYETLRLHPSVPMEGKVDTDKHTHSVGDEQADWMNETNGIEHGVLQRHELIRCCATNVNPCDWFDVTCACAFSCDVMCDV